MRISDWSSDVCSSDLPFQTLGRGAFGRVDEPRPDITHIGTGGDRASQRCPVADAPTQQKGFVPHQRLQFPQKRKWVVGARMAAPAGHDGDDARSEEHTSELQSLMRSSYAVFCLKKKKKCK